MKKTLLSVLSILVVAAVLAGCAPNGISSGDKPMRKINVCGEGIVKLEPDIARVNIGVRSQSEDISEAFAENTADAESVIQSLLDIGIEQKDIQTRNFNIYRTENRMPGPEGEAKIVQAYVVENTVAVTVRELDSLGEILTKVIEEGANTINGITFDIEDREAAIEEARSKAIEDAKSQAEAIADAADVELDEIYSISINRDGSFPVARVQAMAEMPMGGGGSVPIAEGQLTVRVTANIAFSIK
jgi:uncharacterized protein YggE